MSAVTEPAAPAGPAASIGSWLSKLKATVVNAPILEETPPSAASVAPNAVPDVPSTDSKPADASEQNSAGAWSGVRSFWKKATEIGADVIRLDPPEHALPVATSSADVPEGKEVGAVAPTVDDNPNGDEESAGLLGGRLKLAVPEALSFGNIKGMFAKGVATVKSSAPARLLGVTPPTEPQEEEETYWGLSRTQRISLFVVLLCCGLALLSLSLFVFLPLILFAPSKFALSFTMGSCCFMGAFAAFRGPSTFFKGLLVRERLPFTAAYIGSILLTLYAALISQSYIIVMFAGGVQIVALMWYGSTYFPYGRTGMKMLTKFCVNVCQKGCWPCLKACGKLCAS